jgi:ectoine hydroxylase-related dioxygenase (phytanoyl-CoA dioxygenase family)
MLTLNSNIRETFDRDGFVRIDQVFTPAEMDELTQAFEQLHDMADELGKTRGENAHVVAHGSRFTYSPAGHVRHIAHCGNAMPALRKFGRDPRLLQIAALLLGSDEMDQLINQAHYKRSGSAVTFDWHQDSQHRGMDDGLFEDVNGRGSYVQIAIAIDDATPDNGPLQFIPGLQHLGHLGRDLEKHLDESRKSRKVAPLLKRGDIVAFGPYTPHGSEANTSDQSRRVFINGFAYPGANKRDYGLPNAGERLRFGG